MLYLIGLGLGDAKDITVKGLEIVRDAKHVFLEAYTSILSVGKEALVSWIRLQVLLMFKYACSFLKEEFYGRQVVVADRDFVEQSADVILEDALDNDVALLVVGDPLGLVSIVITFDLWFDLIVKEQSHHSQRSHSSSSPQRHQTSGYSQRVNHNGLQLIGSSVV